METIYKYLIPVCDEYHLELPASAKVLTVQVQNDNPYIWVKLDPKASTVERIFRTYGTCHPINIESLDYIGTFQVRGTLVFHLFEVTNDLPH